MLLKVRKKLTDAEPIILKKENLINGRVIPSNPESIRKINAELRRKCMKQRENDAEAEIWAKDHGCC